ncbi:YcxB family protein [Bradyrhizobium manausense]|uniref:YcxB family protein n=1 Tax=Bradyrhizobium manausense TaxID=989370 RepID=UPI001BAD41E4|nr:YcxB family protein [Bradyrhizobium manausense]MBR1086151.1 YcxB family protein [Bradyrhizobium manausense]
MSNATEASGFHFEFQVTRAEDRVFRNLAGKNLKAFIDRRISVGAPLVANFLIIVWACTAVDRGWLTPGGAFGSLMWFILGYYFAFFVIGWSSRRMLDRLFELRGAARIRWQVAFDDVSIVIRTPGNESRMSWSAIAAVKDTDTLVALWYNARIGFFIPATVFADSASRIAFAEWASEHVRRTALLSSDTSAKSPVSPAS